MKTVVIGFVGSTLDRGGGPGRWDKWRPTVAICQQPDLLVDRLELLHARPHHKLAQQVSQDIAEISPETAVRFHLVDPRDPWDFQDVYASLSEFARHYPFDVDNERYLMHISTGTHVVQICLFLLTEAHYFPASLLQAAPPRKQRAHDPGTYNIIDLDLSRYDLIAERFAREKQDSATFLKSGIMTRSAVFNHMIDELETVSMRSTAPMLLIGPTGAGKSQLASRVFALKIARHQLTGEFVAINCATLRGDTAMSTLFGHVKGAFTGAQTERPGLLKKAHKGMVFLDEIGELGVDEQAMLLKAIEEKTFLPLGSDKETTSDFQLIAGTNKNLNLEVKHGHFRDDLLARINLWTFTMPGLKDRREDIEPNVDYELDEFAQRESSNVRFNSEARALYLKFATSPEAIWSGNFRELSASITRMATLASGGRITIDLVRSEIKRLQSAWQTHTPANLQDDLTSISVPAVDQDSLDRFDHLQLMAVVRVCQQSTSLADAGRRLFNRSRLKRNTTNDTDRLRKYLARFDLTWQAIQQHKS